MLSQFEIVDKLGEGSYSSVYKVRRKCDKKIYAMKKVNIPFLSEKERENALNEVRIIASVKHPNIIAYKECFFDAEHRVLCVIMEHADAGDLLQRIRQHRESKTFFQESTIWNIFIQITQALKALHDNHIVHRDLKSANILLCQDGRVKLADFNVSKIVKNNMTKTQIGTPFYASPEIWNFVPYDYRADMWSLGCIIYEMCCLRTPFQGKDMQQICRRVCRGIYQKIPNIYSSDLYMMIKMMLQLQPELRPDCERLLGDAYVQNHIRRSNNQTLLFSTISENNCEMLSTIQWSRNAEQASDTGSTVVKKKPNKLQIEQRDDVFSVRLPPPHYTPNSNQRRRADFETLPETYVSHSVKPQMYSIQPDARTRSNPKQNKKIILKRPRVTNQSRSVDECNEDVQLPYDHYIEQTLIQDEVEPIVKGKAKLQLRPLNNAAFQHSNRKLQVRTETSQSKRIKIFSVQNSQDTPMRHLNQEPTSHYGDDNDSVSRNSIETEKVYRMPRNQNILPRRLQRHSVNEPETKQKIFSSFERPKDLSHNPDPQQTIEEEESDYHQREDGQLKSRNRIQIKQIIDLLQGNPLKPPSIKVTAQVTKNSQSLPNRGIKNELVNKNIVKQDLDEMKSIKYQMQDISRIIQQSINQNSKREMYNQLLKK